MKLLVAFNLLFLSVVVEGVREAPDNCAAEEHGFAKCTPAAYIPDKTWQHELTQCCSHEQCADDECCRNFNFALYCMNPREHSRSYPPICGPADISQCITKVPDPTCFKYADYPDVDWGEIDLHPHSNCNYGFDCPNGDCILFGDVENNPNHAWLQCDPTGTLKEALPFACETIPLGRN
mmetsp:Transcript_13483/g.19880  ORF Transcript_13483/g.19880 Transcript_13483/m.19880 type:complete len:179 (-) Transcript_13483:82-618(-)|eukprot:CAMPEP_0194260600 /NCGR_PEP_ID=MMETSP0158-20130606/45596_1 /TAXON_ID=33649 /ORGANISM="Thalassionema nitzschioides, Strain L26-B" /LENGTH=178 /DNA_ID=CAMNT_0039000695 /DNA_START=37 /DNA_END=573 /DNA_ORIENTATION=+